MHPRLTSQKKTPFSFTKEVTFPKSFPIGFRATFHDDRKNSSRAVAMLMPPSLQAVPTYTNINILHSNPQQMSKDSAWPFSRNQRDSVFLLRNQR